MEEITKYVLKVYDVLHDFYAYQKIPQNFYPLVRVQPIQHGVNIQGGKYNSALLVDIEWPKELEDLDDNIKLEVSSSATYEEICRLSYTIYYNETTDISNEINFVRMITYDNPNMCTRRISNATVEWSILRETPEVVDRHICSDIPLSVQRRIVEKLDFLAIHLL